jgi:hypothetical protein
VPNVSEFSCWDISLETVLTLYTFQYRLLDESELPPGAKWGKEYDTFCIDPTVYLPYLQINCISLGIHFKRATLTHISEAFSLHRTSNPAAVVINCTGVMASKLGGVEDDKVVPVKGQLVVVRNECLGMLCMSGGKDRPAGEYCYVMNRPFGSYPTMPPHTISSLSWMERC